MSSGVILLQSPYISFSSPLLLIPRREITAAAVALFFANIVFQLHTKGDSTENTWKKQGRSVAGSLSVNQLKGEK